MSFDSRHKFLQARKFRTSHASSAFLMTLLSSAAFFAPTAKAGGEIVLRDGWAVQSSAKIKAGGELVSAVEFDTADWYKTTAPKTVFAVLVENGVYKDPYFGTNLRVVPGVSYPIGSQFANQEMPDDSPYAVPWWYRKEFEVPASYRGKRVWLAFHGINYRDSFCQSGIEKRGSCRSISAERE